MSGTKQAVRDLNPLDANYWLSHEGKDTKMAYRLIIGKRDHISENLASDLETADGRAPWAFYPPSSDGGVIPDDKKRDLPGRLIVKSGYNDTQIAICGSDFFTANDQVKSALHQLDPRLEFFPLEEVDLVKRTTRKIWLMHSPHRVQVINLKATGDALIVQQKPSEIINGKLVDFQKFYRVRDKRGLVLDKQACAGLHLWSGIATSISGWFCSEAFKQAVEPFKRSFDFEAVREE